MLDADVPAAGSGQDQDASTGAGRPALPVSIVQTLNLKGMAAIIEFWLLSALEYSHHTLKLLPVCDCIYPSCYRATATVQGGTAGLGMFSTFVNVVQRENISGLWRGTSPVRHSKVSCLVLSVHPPLMYWRSLCLVYMYSYHLRREYSRSRA